MSREESVALVKEKNIQHIAFIMDGNGRWAKKRLMPREYGHKVGAEIFRKILEYCFDLGVMHLTFYAFSTENWKRSEKEISALMKLFKSYMDDAFEEIRKNDVRLIFLGDKSAFSPNLRAEMIDLEERSKNNKYILNIALNYGSRAEIVYAVNKLIKEGKAVTEASLNGALYTCESPDPDLIVRTAGEQRLSNFLLWQAAYSEFYYTDTCWPDMNEEEIDRAIKAFGGRTRRFGAVVNADGKKE